VSAIGSDDNDGTSIATPFKSIDKVNSIMSSLLPGDKVLFRCGDVFRGQINVSKSGTPTSKIVFGAYGTGEKPIISGAKLVNASNWTNLGNGFWQVSHLDKITHLFRGEQIQISARFPNVGYSTINSTNGVKNGGATITSAALAQPAGFWTGATVHVRNQGDAITKSTISGFQANTIQFPGTDYQIVPDFGFYIDNSENALDAEGEWFWNETTRILKIKSITNPSEFQFDGSFYDHAFLFSWSVSNIIIQDLKFSYQTKTVIEISYSNNITIQNNFFKNCLNGVRAGGYTNTEVLNLQIIGNVFHDILNSSITTNQWVNQMIISGNEIKRNSLIPGYEESCLTCGQAISLAGNGAFVSNNKIEDCGYIAINYVNSNHIIEKNWIKNIGLSKNDCGAIQSWGTYTTNNIIRNNFCSEMSGNIEGMPANYGIIAKGIYLDNYQSGNTIEYNTCFDSPNATGIFLYSVRDNVVRFNTVYNNGTQISIAERNPTTPPGNEQDAFYVLSTNNTITDNIGYCLTENQKAVTTYSDYNGTANFGTFNRNLWFNPYSGTIATDMGQNYTLSGWRNTMNRDMQSSAHFLRISPIESVVTTGNNLMANGNFDTNGNGWTTWQDHVNLSVGQNPDFGSSVLTFTGNSGGAQNYANLQSPNFSVDNGAKYLLRFKGSSTNHHVVGIQNAMAESPWNNIAPGINVVLDESVRNYYYLFTPTQNQNPARIGFVQNVPATAYFDDFSLFKYTSIVFENAKQRSPLFINPTATAVNVNLLGSYRDLQNNIISGTIVLPPWSSKILVRTEEVLTIGEQFSTIKNILLYPNPATNFLKITGIENQVKIQIYTLTGAIILKTECKKDQQINFNLAKGFYIVEIIDGNMKTSKKLIVE
jgi:parallel beta-helix repeat protein